MTEIQIRYAGTLIGDICPITTSRGWTKTLNGVDSIEFSVSLQEFANWCVERGTTMQQIIKPLKLDARVVRDGVPLLGGVLLEVPSYSLTNEDLDTVINFSFDGYLNLTAGLRIRPTVQYNERLDSYLVKILNAGLTRATNAGAPTGITIGTCSQLGVDQNTYDSYKSVKDALTEQTDNTTGAGRFDIDFDYKREFRIYKEMGEDRTDTVIHFPSVKNGLNATQVSYDAWSGIATHWIGVGAGNGVGAGGAALTTETTSSQDSAGLTEFGYYEDVFQDSSISILNTLKNKLSGQLAKSTKPTQVPSISLNSNALEFGKTFWIGDRFTFSNTSNGLLSSSGTYRVLEIAVKIDDVGSEDCTLKVEAYAE